MVKSGFGSIFFFLFFILLSPSRASTGLNFYNINDIFGISIRETASIEQDSRGFTWVSSKTGILRLTVDDYRVYQLPLQTANVITVRLAYRHHTLYAITNNGQVFLYDHVLDGFTPVINFAQVLNNPFLYVHSSMVDSFGRLLLATDVGLLIYMNGEFKNFSLLGGVNDIVLYDSGRLIFGGLDGIFIIDLITLAVEMELPALPVPGTQVSKLYFDSTARELWVGTHSSGLFVYDFSGNTFTEVAGIPRQPVRAIEPAGGNTMLVGVDGQGLWEVAADNFRVMQNFREDSDNPNSLRGNGVYDIMATPAGRVWVSTHSGGISYFDKAPTMITLVTRILNEPNSLVNNNVNDVIEDSSGNLWFATNNGLSKWNIKTNTWSSFYNDDVNARVFLTINEDERGNIWAGSFASGLYVLNGATGAEINHLPAEGSLFNNNFVFDIITDSDDNTWLGGVLGEVFRFNPSEREFRSYGQHPVFAIKEYSPGYMLLGCSYGLSRLNEQTGEVEILLNDYLVHDLLVRDGQVWLCTVGEGLVRFCIDTRALEKFTVENSGLPSNFVNSIIEHQGQFWLGTENGICRFNPSDYTVETFPDIRGLAGSSFNRRAAYISSTGQLIWGTNRGAVKFYPSSLVVSPPEGRIFFQDLLILGSSVRITGAVAQGTPVDSIKQLTLRHYQNSLSLEMLPLGMNHGTKFSWFLDGFDGEWSRPVTRRVLNYTNIPEGEYTLRVRMYDNTMRNVIDERAIEIVKLPPYWQTWWFLLMVALFLLGIFYISLKYYIGLIKQLHSEEKIRFFANTAHDMRTALTLINAPIHELEAEKDLSGLGKYYLGLAKSQANRLAAFVTLLMDFQKADVGKERLALKMVDLVKLISGRVAIFGANASANDIRLKFTHQVGSFFAAVDEGMIERVVDNIISNAVKYSRPGGTVEVTFEAGNLSWQVNVRDQGIGISDSMQQQLFNEFFRGDNAISSRISGSGIGLVLAKKYITMHGGSINCESKVNEGSNFMIKVPLNNDNWQKARGEGINLDNNLAGTPPDEPVPITGNDRDNLSSILIVEDYDDLKGFLVKSLEPEFEVFSASDGEEAWQVINDKMPDLIVSDVMMPKMDGFELCKLVKSTFKTSHIPVILLTALSDQADQLHGLGLGADDYLMKPFNTTLLKQRIKTIIANRVAIHEKALRLLKGEEQGQILLNQLNDRFVKKALEVVKENIANPEFSKEIFASAMNVSPSLLYKKLKSTIDQSPTDFIKSIRLAYSIQLLQSREHTITEVSELCGFSSVGYFSTVFKKHYGKSPTEMFD